LRTKPPPDGPAVRTTAVTAADGARRAEILACAAQLFASSGSAGTSLKDVADACGILPGSLYHHFASKEAILLELVVGYQSELDAAGRAAIDRLDLDAAPDGPAAPFGPVLDLAAAIAGIAQRHRAALQVTMYEPPAGASLQFVPRSQRGPEAVDVAMAGLLRQAQDRALVGSGVDTAVLARQLAESMRHVGLAILHGGPAEQVATASCHLLLYGIGQQQVDDAELNRSAATAAADAAVRAWGEPDSAGPRDKAARLRSVARAEFARRGYEATTVRDIAGAAGLAAGSVYRLIGTKEALLGSIMNAFHDQLSAGYDAVLATDATAPAQLDALTWLNLNVLGRFGPELAIQAAWLRAVPPAASDLRRPARRRAGQIAALVADGLRAGRLRTGPVGSAPPPPEVLAACVRDLSWLPAWMVRQQGARAALAHSRATLIRGAAVRAERPC
jgi:AcrR family transcriptional regulator